MIDEKKEKESTELAEVNAQKENDRAFAIVNEKGKPKTLIWSIVALALGILSIVLSALGWAGLIVGVAAVVVSVVARLKMGYFNGLIIAAILTSIFGVIFAAASLIIVAIDPEFFSRLLEGMK